MTAEVPLPPSANRLWRIFGNRLHLSSHYKLWLEEAGFEVRKSMVPVTDYPVTVTVRIYGGRGFTKARDIDNCLKPCLDVLTHTGILAGDNVDHVSAVVGIYTKATAKKAVASCVIEVSA